MSQYLDKSIAAGLLAAIVFTALAHGAVEPWSLALFELMVTVVLLLWGIKATLDKHLAITLPAATLPLAALLLLGIAQSVAFTGEAGQRTSLSMEVEATRHAALGLFFLAASFIVAASFFVTRERLWLLANLLTIFGAMVAAFALIQYFTWNGRFYWVRATGYSVFGPFVNHNHFAGYMAMLVPLPLALLLRTVRGPVQLLYGFVTALMGTAAIVSGSRSGVISLAAALAFMAVLNRRSRRPLLADGFSSKRFGLWRAGPIAFVSLAMIAGVVWIGPTPIIERFGGAVDQLVRSGTPDVNRATIWNETTKLIRDHPILGAGLGTYHTVYPTYATTEKLFGLDYTHNDYLQVLADAGAFGGVIALWFVIVIFSNVYRGIQSRDPLLSGLALAGGTGIFAVLVQSLSDSDLQIPSNALLFLVLSAIVSRVGNDPTVGAVDDRPLCRSSRSRAVIDRPYSVL